MKKVLVFITAFLLSVVNVYAFRTGFNPMDRAVEMIARLFHIPILENEVVRLGFIKFGMFLMVFAVAFWGLRRFMDQKPAGVVSFVISFTGAALTPRAWVLASGGTFTAIMSAIVPVGICIIGLYFVIVRLRPGENLVYDIIAIIILLALLALIELYMGAGGIIGLALFTPKIKERLFKGWRSKVL